MVSTLKLYLLACLICAPGTQLAARGPVSKEDSASLGQTQFAEIIVNGRTLTGPNTKASRIGGKILLPVAAVARTLGDVVNVDPSSRTVSVRRQNGVIANFDPSNGQISENGRFLRTVSNAADLTISSAAADLLLSTEIVAALLDVGIRFEADKNTLFITRGPNPTSAERVGDGRGFAELHRVDYEYDLNRYSASLSQNLTLTALGRLGDGRVTFTSNSSHVPSRGLSVRNTTLTLERPNGQRYLAGDFGTAGELQFLSANLRGASTALPVGDLTVTAFGGRSFSGSEMDFKDPVQQVRSGFSYDTNVLGAFLSSNSISRPRQNPRISYAGGAMYFGGPGRAGSLAGGNIGYTGQKLRLQADAALGRFDQVRADNSRSSGTGAALDIAGTYQVSNELALQARYTKIGRNFSAPQAGVREPLDLKAAGIAWSPAKWFSASINASTAKRPGDSAQSNKFVTAAFSVTPTAGATRFYVSHTQSRTAAVRSGAFTLLNASKDFSRIRFYANVSRIQNSGTATLSAQLGANYSSNDANSVEFSQSLGSRRALNGQFDWRSSNLLGHRVSLAAGVGYSHGGQSGFSTHQKMTASVRLPGNSALQLNYFHAGGSSAMLISLKGSIFKKRESNAFLESSVSEMNHFGKVSGRVYQDVDGSGRFEPGVDRPQPDVKVRVDGNRYVVSDANGLYSFESITAGSHKIYLDLLSVRADLTLLDEAGRDTVLRSGTASVQDFRLVRTGRITGRVWLDTNENGKFDTGESPLADIRVTTAAGRDALTDADGYFVLADLPPGEHILQLDAKSLPEKTVAPAKPLAIQAFAGRETTDVNLLVTHPSAEVKKFASKQN